MNLKLVVLSGFRDVFDWFKQSVEMSEPAIPKILVTSRGMDPGTLNPTWTVIEGKEPFIFARNANLGIKAAGDADVFLVNDDIKFCRRNSLSDLYKAAVAHPEVGVLSPQFLGQVGNPMQNRRHVLDGLGYTTERLGFTAVLIKRSTLDQVGLLDERFEGYGCEDDDYCARVVRVGLKLGVTSEVILRHGFKNQVCSASFTRTHPQLKTSADAMRERLLEKWNGNVRTSNDGVTLITATGNRPDAFNLCRLFVERQDWDGKLQWIVVDDGNPPEKDFDFDPRWTKTVIRPEPKWKPGQNTLARNIQAALPDILYDKILFIEDDDWYANDYVRFIAGHLENCQIVGEAPAHYYHLPSRQFYSLSNRQHASMCQTGIRRDALPVLWAICAASNTVLNTHTDAGYIDIRLWQQVKGPRRLLTGMRSIGLKGLPGRAGIGMGHRPQRGVGWMQDPTLKTLRSWIGNDVELYFDPVKHPVAQNSPLEAPARA